MEYLIILNKKALMFIIAFAFVLAIAGTSAAAVNETENITTTNITDECVGSDPIINGTITVNEYGHTRPLEGATVIVNSNSGKTLASTTTDANGYYSVNFYSAETTFNIIASYVGCTPITQSITVANGPNYPTDPNKYGTLNFTLTPKTATLTGTGNGRTVYIQGQNKNGFAGVINVRVDGTTYVAYCIDLFTPISINDQLLVNGPLPGTAGDLPSGVEWDKVSYILNNYSPSSNNEAAAIQCAIWYFTSVHYGTYNPYAPSGTYYQYMTAPRDGRIDGYYGSTTVRTRAWNIINQVNAATIPPYPNTLTLTPETTTVANGQTVTVTATVKDVNGNPVQGITVNFRTTSGSITATGTTDANGQVSRTLTLPDNQNAVVTAYVSGNYGNLLYDDQYASVRKQNLVARNVFPLTISDISIVNTAATANVALTQNATSTANVGDTVTYTITATNNGPDTASGILISDIVPEGLRGVTVTPSVGTYYNGIWTIPTLANGVTATLTITGTVTPAMAGLTTTNTATRTAQEQYNSMPTSISADIYTNSYIPDVSLYVNNYPWKTSTYTYDYKQQIVWLAQINNIGTTTATGIIANFVIGNAFKVVSYNLIQPGTLTFDEETNTFTWTIANLGGGYNLTRGSYAAFSVLLESLTSGSGTPDFALTSSIISCDQNNIGTTKTRTRNLIINSAADIQITENVSNKNPTTGEYVTITITAKNNGPNNATGITITDKLPTELYLDPDTDPNTSYTTTAGTYNPITGIWTIPTLNNNTEATLTIIARVNTTTGTTFANHAYLSGTPEQTDWNTSNNSENVIFNTETNDVSLYVNNYPWKTSTYTYDYKQQIVWLAQINNIGTTTATGIIANFVIGNAFKVVSYNLIQPGTLTFDEETNTFTWTIANLGGGYNLTRGSYAAFSVLLESLTSGSGTPDFALTSSIISCDQNNIGTTKTRTRNLIINSAADIQITENVSNKNPTTGEYVTITITAKNNGPNNATGITITDKLPTELYLDPDTDPNTSYTTTAGTYNPITGIWTIPTLNNNTEATLTIIARVNTTTGTTFANHAYLSGTPEQTDWNTSNNSNNNYMTTK